MDKVFKALADPGRRLLLDRLRANNGQTLGELCDHLDMTRQAVDQTSQDAGRSEPGRHASGTAARSCTSSNPVPIHQIADRWIDKFEARPTARVGRSQEASGRRNR